MIKLLLTVSCLLLLLACNPTPESPKVRIAINPWPGYEFLYLAAEKGFFKQNGLNIEIIELSSLADVQRVFIQGRVDGFGSTLIEVVQAAGITQQPVDVVLVPDFSFGGDVIVGNDSVNGVADLKGKRVGVEVGSLGMYVLHVALVKYGLTLDDVQVVNVEQLDVMQAMTNSTIDAVVTYPPYSIEVSKLPQFKSFFDTREIPEKVIDTITIRGGLIAQDPQWLNKFHRTWQQSLTYAQDNQAEAYALMAKREGVSVAEFTEALTGLSIVAADKQLDLLGSRQLKQGINDVCQALTQSNAITFDCANINELVSGFGHQQD